MQTTLSMRLPENRYRSPFEWMVGPNDGDVLWQVFEMGSVSYVRSTESTTTN